MRQSNIPTGEAKLHPAAPVTQTTRMVGWVVYQFQRGFLGFDGDHERGSGNKDLDLSLNAQIMRS